MSNWEAHTKEQYGAPHFMDDGLPSWCFGFDIAENKAVLLLWKMGGYSPLSYASGTTQEEIAMANESWGVTREQGECMLIGAMFGWGVPGARLSMEGEI
jgi:hypothetical protein|tara:strand:+ start:382 stop:678 length:297 start_codon:yes stop_codon:yes gene_type:complete